MNAIACVSKNWVIGNKGTIPWNSPEDMKFFKAKTSGNYVVMGRRTAESLPRGYLPERANIVISKAFRPMQIIDGNTSIVYVGSTEAVKTWELTVQNKQVWVCGGARIYRSLLMFCDSFFLTVLDISVNGDTYFPFSEEQIQEAFPYKRVVKEITFGTIYEYSQDDFKHIK